MGMILEAVGMVGDMTIKSRRQGWEWDGSWGSVANVWQLPIPCSYAVVGVIYIASASPRAWRSTRTHVMSLTRDNNF